MPSAQKLTSAPATWPSSGSRPLAERATPCRPMKLHQSRWAPLDLCGYLTSAQLLNVWLLFWQGYMHRFAMASRGLSVKVEDPFDHRKRTHQLIECEHAAVSWTLARHCVHHNDWPGQHCSQAVYVISFAVYKKYASFSLVPVVVQCINAAGQVSETGRTAASSRYLKALFSCHVLSTHRGGACESNKCSLSGVC
eukprot:6457670-Amphidinium_carterae.1